MKPERTSSEGWPDSEDTSETLLCDARSRLREVNASMPAESM